MKCAFLVNARSSTISHAFYQASLAGGYLFPPDRPTARVVAALAQTRAFVLSDNGAFDEVGRLAMRASAISGRDRWARVMKLVRDGAASIDSNSQLPVQLSVKPNAVIGAEDVTLATWLRSGVREQILRGQRRTIRALNERVAERGVRLQQQLAPSQVLTVASAHDYDTARDAGIAFARAGIHSAAMGFGAFMADDSWSDAVKVGGHVRSLPRSLPMRYLRTALVARGFFDGWTTGRLPAGRFHFLGLGAPIMLPIASLPAIHSGAISFDATSPIKDAVEGTLYVSRPAALKVRSWKVAESMGRGESAWSCPCGFCREFTAINPFDLAAIQRLATSGRPIKSTDLVGPTRLASAAPLFRMGGGALARAAEQARIGHNHWVLGRLTRNISLNARDLEQWTGNYVELYETNAGALHFAESVRLAFEIVREDGNF